ncbi:ZPR1 zinc-finger domain-containing protein [Suillus paluster]|nr:ZPR1 zinc-finger domain-containing protein [Suillus paluster]KAG1756918.1 ZPR1 zinc-finger domain-containing protein [Suillus paluster]
MQCGEQGVTRVMLTSIPFFREVIVMSFCCEHCGHSNNGIQSAGKIRHAHSFISLPVPPNIVFLRQAKALCIQ